MLLGSLSHQFSRERHGLPNPPLNYALNTTTTVLLQEWIGFLLWHINHCRLSHAKSIFIHITVLFRTIQFSISIQFSSILPTDRTLSGATTPGQIGPGSNANIGVLRILQSSSITRASPLDCLALYPGHSLGESYHSTEMHSVYSATPADWEIFYQDSFGIK